MHARLTFIAAIALCVVGMPATVQLEEALRRAARSTIEMATAHFLTGLRGRGSLSA